MHTNRYRFYSRVVVRREVCVYAPAQKSGSFYENTYAGNVIGVHISSTYRPRRTSSNYFGLFMGNLEYRKLTRRKIKYSGQHNIRAPPP